MSCQSVQLGGILGAMTPFQPVREVLAECRRAGEGFEVVWQRVLEVSTPEDRRVLEQTEEAWRAGFERRQVLVLNAA